MRALKIAATGMAAQQMRVETISNNLANMSTTGYNTRRAEFADLHYQQLTRARHDQRRRWHGSADGCSAGPRRAPVGGDGGSRAGLAVRPTAISTWRSRARVISR